MKWTYGISLKNQTLERGPARIYRNYLLWGREYFWTAARLEPWPRYSSVSRGRYFRDASTSPHQTRPDAMHGGQNTLTLLSPGSHRNYQGSLQGPSGRVFNWSFLGEEGDAPILISDPHFYHQHHHGRDIRTVDSTLHQSVRCKTTSSLYQRRPTCLSHPTSHYLYWSCLRRASLRAHRLPRTFACSGDVCDSLAGAWLAPARRGRPSSVCTTLLPSLFDGTSSPRIGQLSSLSFAVFHGEEAMYFSNHHCNISDAFAPSRYSGEEMWRPQRYDGWRRAEHSGDSNFYWMADRQGPSVSTIYQLSSM